MSTFGTIVLFGSGETSNVGHKVHDSLFSHFTEPIRVAILETPAGFQPNSAQVANQVADFLQVRLKNFSPEISVVAARQRGTEFSPDRAEIIAPLLTSNVIFLGAGSPTYAARQLQDSLGWQTLVGRHRQGASIVLASASVLAASAYTLPVYEIFKAGETPHWKPGLNFFGAYGLELVLMPHWNNTEGGTDLDTRFCFMGQARFEQLLDLLPDTSTIVGIDEHTALMIEPETGQCQVFGVGNVTVLKQKGQLRYQSAREFKITDFGNFQLPDPAAGLPPQLWKNLLELQNKAAHPAQAPVPHAINALVEEREAARRRRDWASADKVRGQLYDLGWSLQDTPAGPKLTTLTHP